MKKIITMVGTSIFTNRIEHNVIRTKYKELEKEPYECWEEQLDAGNIKELKTATKQALKNNRNYSAEIKSILSIAKELKENVVEVYLLATDTVLSRLACELIEEWFIENNKGEPTIDVKFNEKQDVIEELQIENSQTFQKGLVNLITRFYAICGDYFDGVIINITGGYKAIIPYLTILGQVNKVPVKYIFEDTDTLIEIPFLPLIIDNDLFEKYEKEFYLIDKETSLEKKDHYQFTKDASSCLEMAETQVSLNSLGIMLWGKHKQKYFFFYASNEVWKEIQSQENIKRILRTKFRVQESRQGKTEKKKDHYVYDDGNNNNRIYYFEKNEGVYIYKTFENEQKAKAFINTPFNEKVEIDKAELRKLEIESE